ncbi:hypothetical protein RIF29_19847 [Crotalaria pallida]|uniref:Uncharacterized protein n=1 Tax=Crotalaria pallida TaxID=3830 RepID=A0AAN9F050_CROPI
MHVEICGGGVEISSSFIPAVVELDGVDLHVESEMSGEMGEVDVGEIGGEMDDDESVKSMIWCLVEGTKDAWWWRLRGDRRRRGACCLGGGDRMREEEEEVLDAVGGGDKGREERVEKMRELQAKTIPKPLCLPLFPFIIPSSLYKHSLSQTPHPLSTQLKQG